MSAKAKAEVVSNYSLWSQEFTVWQISGKSEKIIAHWFRLFSYSPAAGHHFFQLTSNAMCRSSNYTTTPCNNVAWSNVAMTKHRGCTNKLSSKLSFLTYSLPRNSTKHVLRWCQVIPGMRVAANALCTCHFWKDICLWIESGLAKL